MLCGPGTQAHLTLMMPKTGFALYRTAFQSHLSAGMAACNRSCTAKIEVLQTVVYNTRNHHKHDYNNNIIIGNFSCQIQSSGSCIQRYAVEFDLPPSVILGLATDIITVSHPVRLWITHDHSLETGTITIYDLQVRFLW